MSNVAGVITAAGASRRMGYPKALLRTAAGQTLAESQVELLRSGGCDPVAVVVGAGADRIRAEVPSTVTLIENPEWAKGRLTSVQVGLRHVCAHDVVSGIILLPVDVVGIRIDTVAALIEKARSSGCEAIRPVHEGQAGHIVWISRTLSQHLLEVDCHPDTAVRQILDPHTTEWPLTDPGILANVNTPADWDVISNLNYGHKCLGKTG